MSVSYTHLACLCIAELAATGTDISPYHKSGRTFSPTFSHIGTTSAAAYLSLIHILEFLSVEAVTEVAHYQQVVSAFALGNLFPVRGELGTQVNRISFKSTVPFTVSEVPLSALGQDT